MHTHIVNQEWRCKTNQSMAIDMEYPCFPWKMSKNGGCSVPKTSARGCCMRAIKKKMFTNYNCFSVESVEELEIPSAKGGIINKCW